MYYILLYWCMYQIFLLITLFMLMCWPTIVYINTHGTNKHISSMKRMCKKHVWKNHTKRQPGTTRSHIPKESNGSATSLNSVDFWRCQAIVKLSTCRFFMGHENLKKRHGTICTLFFRSLTSNPVANLLWMWLCSVSVYSKCHLYPSDHVFLKFTQKIATCITSNVSSYLT